MKKNYLLFAALLSCIGCKKDVGNDIYVINCENAQDVCLEDVATDVRIVPLQSDEPIDGCYKVIGTDDEVLMIGTSYEHVYYFKDSQLQGILHSVGRGPGEYVMIQNISYDPDRKVLYLLQYEDKNGILQYSVPDMKFMGRLAVPAYSVEYVRPYDSNTLLVAMRTEPDVQGLYFYDIPSGQISGKLCDLNAFTYTNAETALGSFSKEHPYVSLFDAAQQISGIGADSAQVMFRFNFGTDTPDGMIYEHMKDLDDVDRKMGYMFADENSHMIRNFYYPIYNDNENVSFWYTNLMLDFYNYFKMENGKQSMYKGLTVPGLNIKMKPSFGTGHGYAIMIEGDKESLRDTETALSPLGKKILDAVSNQKDDNPVILYFSI